MAGIEEKLGGLATMSPAQLRAEWRRLHRGQPLLEDMSMDLLARSIAWRWQERALGALPPTRVKELSKLARQVETSGDLAMSRRGQVKAGSRLVREWHGKVHVVTVLDQGYEYDNRHYASLTPIARDITGAAWSGPRFFGLVAARAGRGHDG
jgi:hypothetical protein